MENQDQIVNLLSAILAQLQSINAQIGKPSDYSWTPEGLPICPRHGEPMARREKQGDIWYSHKVIDDDGQEFYCRGYSSKNSPGWDVGPDEDDDPDGGSLPPGDRDYYTRIKPNEPAKWLNPPEAEEIVMEIAPPRQPGRTVILPAPAPGKAEPDPAKTDREIFYMLLFEVESAEEIKPKALEECKRVAALHGWKHGTAALQFFRLVKAAIKQGHQTITEQQLNGWMTMDNWPAALAEAEQQLNMVGF